MYSSRIPTVFMYCCLSAFSPWHWKTVPFMPSVLPLKMGPLLLPVAPLQLPRPPCPQPLFPPRPPRERPLPVSRSPAKMRSPPGVVGVLFAPLSLISPVLDSLGHEQLSSRRSSVASHDPVDTDFHDSPSMWLKYPWVLDANTVTDCKVSHSVGGCWVRSCSFFYSVQMLQSPDELRLLQM
jgi:hypothetical protein